MGGLYHRKSQETSLAKGIAREDGLNGAEEPLL